MTKLTILFHWLKVSERIKFRLFVLSIHVACTRHATASSYFAESLRRIPLMAASRRLHSATMQLLVRTTTRLSTLGDRAFPAMVTAT